MSDAAPTTIRDLLQNIVNAPTWEEARQRVADNQALLLTDEADAEFARWIDEGSAITDVLTRADLTWYRTALQRCREEDIDTAFTTLPEPRPLNKALRAFLNADSPEALSKIVQLFPESISDDASEALQNMIAQITDQERAAKLAEAFNMIQMVRLANRSILRELLQLLTDWINTATWNESRDFLQANAERLLTEEAIEVIDVLLAQEGSKDEEQQNQRAIKTLQQHRAILEQARKDSIEAAYAGMFKPSPVAAIPPELRDPIQAMIAVEGIGELLDLLAQNPVLLTPQAIETIEQLFNALREDGQEDLARLISDRFNILKQVIEWQQDPGILTIAFKALERADTPGKIQQAIMEQPALLDEKVLNVLKGIVDALDQAGNTAAASTLRLRLGEIQRIWQLREQASHVKQDEAGNFDQRSHTTTSAEDHSMAFGNNFGPVSQYNQSIEKSPEKQWQQPAQQTLDRKFVGRRDELNTLLSYLTNGENVTITGQPASTPGGQTTSVILQGMAGIGKTFLARKLAIEIDQHYTEIFPGRVIWVEVGPDVKDESNMQRPLWELASFAFAGSPPVGPMNPQTVKSWLEETAPGRLLIILDDVWHPAALRILSEALPAKAVRLVTTRHTGVAKTLEGKLITLGLLSLEDGIALLQERLHCQNDTRYQEDLKALVGLLEGHALALDIAAAQIEEPEEVKTLLDDLRQEIGRGELSGLSLQDEERDDNLEKSLGLSYKHTNAEQQNHFRSLGVFAPETPITPESAAAIWEIDERSARKTLNELQHLALLNRIGEPGSYTYRQHSLLRAYALALLNSHNELTSASWSHAHYYADLVWQAEQAVPKNYPLLDQHLQNILAALQWSVENEPRLFSELLDGASQFLFLRGQFSLLGTYLPQATNAAATIGDKGRQANLLRSLGDLEHRLGHLEAARSHYNAALPLFKAEQSQLGQANLLKSLGDLEYRLGHLEVARSHYDAALPLFKAVQDQLGQANLLKSLGDLEYRLGHLEVARSHYDAALPLFKAVQSQLGQANLLQSLGDLEYRLGHLEVARSHYDAALPLFKAEQSQLGQANVYMSIADMFLAQKEWEQARSYYEQALPLFIAVQDPLGQANTLIDLGRVRFELGDREQGIKDVERAAVLFRSLQDDEWERRAELYLAQMRSRLSQSLEERATVGDIARALDEFARADWQKRRELLDERSELLLGEAVEPVFDMLVEANKENASGVAFLESQRVLLRRCGMWGVDATFYFALQMRLGDDVAIPAAYEDAVMQAAGLLARRGEDGEALVKAVEAMEALLHSLPDDSEGLFRGALLRDLADAMLSLPRKHALRRLETLEAYYREALAIYQEQAADRSISRAVIRRALGDVLSEQGRYDEAAETLQAAIQGFKEEEGRSYDTAWALSSYASALDRVGKQEEALAAYDEALALLPDSAPLLRNRAETLISLRRLEEVEADLARAVELDGNENSPYLWFRRAQLALARGEAELAEQRIGEVLSRDSSFDVLLAQAQSAWLCGDLDIAQQKLRQALEQANQGTRAAMRREMEHLLAEHPALAGGDEMRAILNGSEE